MKTIKTLAAALLATGLTLTATPASAQPAAQTVAIHYGDLDLATPDGRGTLDSRIRQAIRTACGEASPSDLQGQNRAAACRAELSASLSARRSSLYATVRDRQAPVLAASR
jgi:UrcA family protein